MEFIDKAAILAIIEKLKDEALEYGDKSRWFLVAALTKEINSLEVKEVDFDAEWEKYFEHRGNMATVNIKHLAKHFFELGLKAHDNWKVVDNINPPQADKNKIYCVLSKKNKYLLARVINHPQDEDLLQWKCTEFPFHRYDMCEGDKYMQII